MMTILVDILYHVAALAVAILVVVVLPYLAALSIVELREKLLARSRLRDLRRSVRARHVADPPLLVPLSTRIHNPPCLGDEVLLLHDPADPSRGGVRCKVQLVGVVDGAVRSRWTPAQITRMP